MAKSRVVEKQRESRLSCPTQRPEGQPLGCRCVEWSRCEGFQLDPGAFGLSRGQGCRCTGRGGEAVGAAGTSP